jgi:hypothetical protein
MSGTVSYGMAVSILSTVSGHWAWSDGGFIHGHLVFRHVALTMFSAHSWNKIHEEREDEESVYKRNDPFENSSCIPLLSSIFNTETYKKLT